LFCFPVRNRDAKNSERLVKLLNLGSPKKQKARQIAAPLLSVVILFEK
jgi:hypothetical protein